MVIIDPLFPNFPPTSPFQPAYPWCTGTDTCYSSPMVHTIEKAWKERHIKEVKKGIMIFFEGDDQPLFIATDDKCWSKIQEALKK